ncbi:MAG: hypothetical protein OZSIB_3910 [Candidatus Ozemobacter sibiricus]|uniref:Uncharacterized protein n=1 Tax=Candidatus Ozemobacter sibiricus TaxID=2268124 RepID=A0A367ZP05_9BACT|nr:MAG: hypothetical protein OZSIB_3910 [Candidatus Ozemobacter sibiricus]
MTEPVEPVDPDPDGQLRPVQGPSGKSRFQFTPPKMPDWKKLRQKATRVTLQRTASGSEMTEVETFDCSDLEGERRKITQLEAAIQALPAGPLRSALEARLTDQRRRVAAAEELARLLPPAAADRSVGSGAEPPGAVVAAASPVSGAGAGPSEAGAAAVPVAGMTGPEGAVMASATTAAASVTVGLGRASANDLRTAALPTTLSPAQRRRVEELRRILWPPPRPPAPVLPAAGAPPPGAATRATASATPPVGRIPEQFYRPEPRKSFYQEMKEAREQDQEEEASVAGPPADAAGDAADAADAAASPSSFSNAP